jgi:site-specific recombinase XerD
VGLMASDIEAFVCLRGSRISRASLQHEVAHLRSLLRFLAMRGEIPTGLDGQIDTSRVYRLEKLPRALPWEIVGSFLRSIDRSTARGLRDYAIFLLIATYGLRTSEIVNLTLDDIDWRAGQICVRPRKNQIPLLLPLTETVRTVLVDYLHRGRPALPHREIFLRCLTPGGRLGATAVGESFRAWSSRSGLPIPWQGPHCLRHSYAVHLLRQGTPLKTLGDVLGHRSAESTCVYLRLAVEDLRDVALSLPEDGSWEL